MKQLLINFMFFVATAFIFVACAKIFPSEEKTDYPTSITPADNTINKTQIKINEIDAPVISNKTNFIKLYRKQSTPARKIVKINPGNIFHPSFDLKGDNLS